MSETLYRRQADAIAAKGTRRPFPFSRMRELWAADAVLRDEVRAANEAFRDERDAAERKRGRAVRIAYEAAAARFYAKADEA